MNCPGSVPVGSLVATLQSAAMGSYGATLVANMARAGAGMSSAALVYRAYTLGKRH
jgi:hypothetical protein